MPVYILHGFRWPRDGFMGIRVFIVLHNVEEAAAEYLQQPVTSRELLKTFQRLEPDIMARIPEMHFIEQYDPDDLEGVSQPYAYVADKVITLPDKTMPENGLSRNVEEILKLGSELSEESSKALEELRAKYAENEKIGWWVVYNGDPDRAFDEDEETEEEEEEEGEEEAASIDSRPRTAASMISRPRTAGSIFRREPREEKVPPVPPLPKEKLRHRLFGRKGA
ncbi:hypothetical protein DTO271D3_1936 [Paecilomyces variotii]|nr:hypothetical protein DTO271D3_1936 [Paecilomyces variotii]